MKSLCALALAAAIFSVSPASAQVVDLNTIKCSEFRGLGKDAIFGVIMWMTGYYTDEDAPAVIDFDRVKSKLEEIAKKCDENPSMALTTVAEPIMSE